MKEFVKIAGNYVQVKRMKGKCKIVTKNNRLHYGFEVKRNITVFQGDSAIGETALTNMLR